MGKPINATRGCRLKDRSPMNSPWPSRYILVRDSTGGCGVHGISADRRTTAWDGRAECIDAQFSGSNQTTGGT